MKCCTGGVFFYLTLINVIPTTTLDGSFVTISIDTISASPDQGGKNSRMVKSEARTLLTWNVAKIYSVRGWP